MAQAQLTQQAHHQVQRHRHNDVHRRWYQHVGHLPVQKSGVQQGCQHKEQCGHRC